MIVRIIVCFVSCAVCMSVCLCVYVNKIRGAALMGQRMEIISSFHYKGRGREREFSVRSEVLKVFNWKFSPLNGMHQYSITQCKLLSGQLLWIWFRSSVRNINGVKPKIHIYVGARKWNERINECMDDDASLSHTGRWGSGWHISPAFTITSGHIPGPILDHSAQFAPTTTMTRNNQHTPPSLVL